MWKFRYACADVIFFCQDLAKWKDRRKSYTSDLQKKKEEREEIEKQALEKSERSSKTFKEMLQDR